MIPILAAQSSNSSASSIDRTASLHAWLFGAYVLVLVLAAILTWLVWRSGNQLQGVIRADADARIAKAQADSQMALAEQEKLRRENLQLSIKLEEERAARLKIEERLAPRRFTGEQQRALTAKLRPFSGTKANLVVVSVDDSEVVTFSNGILASLKEAGWVIGVMAGTDLSRAVSGVLVEVAPDADESARAAANTLVSAILADNLGVHGQIIDLKARAGAGMFSGGSVPDAKIRITIGKK